MSVDILVRSHARDFPWLEYCLRSVERFCTGFRQVVLVVPRASAPWLPRYRLPADRVELCEDVRDDYLGQQVTKLHADLFSDADLICHLDADCVVDCPLAPADLMLEGRPAIPCTEYRLLGASVPWRAVTEKLLGFPVEHDFMRTQPLLYPRALYAELRSHCHALHGVALADYVLAQPPRGFSEFNALGAYAHRFHHDEFAWPVLESTRQQPRHCRWYWSWGGLDAELRRELEALLA